jgi:hypothetical protein
MPTRTLSLDSPTRTEPHGNRPIPGLADAPGPKLKHVLKKHNAVLYFTYSTYSMYRVLYRDPRGMNRIHRDVFGEGYVARSIRTKF